MINVNRIKAHYVKECMFLSLSNKMYVQNFLDLGHLNTLYLLKPTIMYICGKNYI